MSDDKRPPCPAHFAYGIALVLALTLGFLAGVLSQPAPERGKLPDDFAPRFTAVEKNTRALMMRQQLLLRKLLPDWSPLDPLDD